MKPHFHKLLDKDVMKRFRMLLEIDVHLRTALLLEQRAIWPLASLRSTEGQERAAVAILYPQRGGKTLHFSKHFLPTLECVHLGLNITRHQLRLVANRGPRSLARCHAPIISITQVSRCPLILLIREGLNDWRFGGVIHECIRPKTNANISNSKQRTARDLSERNLNKQRSGPLLSVPQYW